MPKTVPPGEITVPGVGTFIANALPDPFDGRDLEYRPRLQSLPHTVDQRTLNGLYVLRQDGQSCTGHAVSTLINTVLASDIVGRRSGRGGASGRKREAALFPRVSPYMLYRLGRRYDEFEGEEDAGSSLRGVFKGWFHHGVALEEDWPALVLDVEPDIDHPGFARRCIDRPLGAFYRVNPYQLDDMQSAIDELHAIAVSAVIHDGWERPVPVERNGAELHVIARQVNGRSLGGHAFALVGYNEVGFLVQNSWGTAWGKGGFATLPYEDWLDSAYDAWVARPGVPKTPFAAGRTQTARATGGALVTAPGPDLKRLTRHVINLGNDGFLSTKGKFVSTPAQIDRLFAHMERWHDVWCKPSDRDGLPGGTDEGHDPLRHILIYAHGGLTSEVEGLETAQKQLNWWLNNQVYPLFFAWQSGAAETLVDQLVDTVRTRVPFAVGFDFAEQVDRLVEKVARGGFTWMWDQMKQNARGASRALDVFGPIEWPALTSAARDHMAAQPGASLIVHRLAHYIAAHGADAVRVHLIGHSAGSIFLAGMLERLREASIAVETMAYLAPAIRVDEFEHDVLPHLGTTVKRFATFAMSDQRELDDVCGANGINVYQKSLLYLVSRALERPGKGDAGEVPLVGMERFFDRPLQSAQHQTLRTAIEAAGGASIFSRSAAPDDSRSDATRHGWIDDDAPTMTSVVMRMRSVTNALEVDDYVPNAALKPVSGIDSNGEAIEPADIEVPEAADSMDRPRATLAVAPSLPSPTVLVGSESSAGPRAPMRMGTGEQVGEQAGEPLRAPAAVKEPGEVPVTETKEPQTERPSAPRTSEGRVVEVADAPRTGSSVLDLLQETGWQVSGVSAEGSAKAGRAGGPRRRTVSEKGAGVK